MNRVGVCLRARVRASAVVCVLLLLAAHATSGVRAQDLDDVQITGRVADEHGASVAGARVSATLKGSAVAREAETDGEGRFRLVELAPGDYVVRASREGFAAEERTNVSTLSGQTVRLDFVLRAAGPSVEETIVSAAETPPVDTSRTVAGGTVTRDEAERLPVASRSPLDLLFTLPGVTEETLSTRDAAEDRDAAGRATRERAAETPEEAGTHAVVCRHSSINRRIASVPRDARRILLTSSPRRNIVPARDYPFRKPLTRPLPSLFTERLFQTSLLSQSVATHSSTTPSAACG